MFSISIDVNTCATFSVSEPAVIGLFQFVTNSITYTFVVFKFQQQPLFSYLGFESGCISE